MVEYLIPHILLQLYEEAECKGGGNICPTLTTGEPNILRITVTKGDDADVIH